MSTRVRVHRRSTRLGAPSPSPRSAAMAAGGELSDGGAAIGTHGIKSQILIFPDNCPQTHCQRGSDRLIGAVQHVGNKVTIPNTARSQPVARPSQQIRRRQTPSRERSERQQQPRRPALPPPAGTPTSTIAPASAVTSKPSASPSDPSNARPGNPSRPNPMVEPHPRPPANVHHPSARASSTCSIRTMATSRSAPICIFIRIHPPAAPSVRCLPASPFPNPSPSMASSISSIWRRLHVASSPRSPRGLADHSSHRPHHPSAQI
ncbi:hypothetical protein ACLOJK_014735 [Asimina triloba]